MVRPVVQPLAAASDLTKAYGPHIVLENAQFVLHDGQKAALVGPNGAGKTTLFRLLAGEIRPELGKLELRRDARVGYLPQVPNVGDDVLVREALAAPTSEVQRLEGEAAALEAWMAEPDAWEQSDASEKSARYGEIQTELAQARSKADVGNDPILSDLGVAEELLAQKFGSLSGGEKSKVLLARALANAKEKDLLLLDEPTNHMDIPTIEWIEEYLLDIHAAVVVSSHDKFLLDNVSQHVFEVGNRRVLGYEGNYTSYRGQKEAIARAWEAKRKRNHDELKRQLAIIEDFKKRKRYTQIQSRKQMVEDLRSQAASLPVAKNKAFRLAFQAAGKSGRSVLTVHDVEKKHDGRTLFRNVGFEIEKGDKIGLIGPNGCGKTTLLEILVGAQGPDAGTVERSQSTHIGYFAQHHRTLDFERTLYDEIRSVRDPPPTEAWCRGILGRFGFGGEHAFKKVSELSGGERARLALAKFIAHEHNFLVLDEPTNHLDIESQEIVAGALREYPGSLLVVSHNRSFLNEIVNKVAVIDHHEVAVFQGDFNDSWTAAKLGDFLTSQRVQFRVHRVVRDWERSVTYQKGDKIEVTGAETQAFRRLLRWAEAEGRIERVETATSAQTS